MSDTPVKLWRYVLPSEKGEGRAVIHMDSLGFFAAVSDYGNYSYAWGSHGMDDFRKFVIHMEEDYDYCGNKLSHDKWNAFDKDATVKNIKRKIIEKRKDGGLDKDLARDHWDLMMDLDNCDIEFGEWIKTQDLFEDWSEAADCASHEPSPDILAFCKKTLPRLAKVLRAELEAEASAGVESEPQTA